MKRDLAVRLAATDDDEVRVAQVRHVIAAFLKNLIKCSVCDGEGSVTFKVDTSVRLLPSAGLPARPGTVAAGTTSACPACAGTGLDPESGEWRCLRGQTPDLCQSSQDEGTEDIKEQHRRCGYRALVPLEDDDPIKGRVAPPS